MPQKRKENEFFRGDVVTIKEDCEVGKVYDEIKFTEQMDSQKGQRLAIQYESNGRYYTLTGGPYSGSMLELLRPTPLKTTKESLLDFLRGDEEI